MQFLNEEHFTGQRAWNRSDSPEKNGLENIRTV